MNNNNTQDADMYGVSTEENTEITTTMKKMNMEMMEKTKMKK